MRTLIGRDAELAHLRDLVRGAPAAATMLVVTGDRGCGKSSLLAAATRMARQTGGRRVLTLQGSPDRRRPLRQLLLGAGHDPAIADHDQAHLRVRSVIADLATTAPVLLVADDLHELDEPTSHLLVDLASVRGVTVLGASRSPSGGETLELLPLGREDAVRLLAEQAGNLTPGTRAEILHRAAGNPAALLELSGDAPPGGLLAEFRAALDPLPGATRTLLLRAASMLPTDPALIFTGPGDGWEPACAAGLVTFTGDGVAFTHPLVAEAVYRAAPAHLRRRTHQQLAVALSAYPEHQALQLAAADPGPDERTAAALEAAATIFRSRGDLFRATVAMQQATQRSGSRPSAARRLTRAITDARDLRDTAWVAELLARIWHLTDDPDVLAEAVRPAASAMVWAGRHHEAYGMIIAAHRAGPMTDPHQALNLAVNAAMLAWLTGAEEHRLALVPLLEAADPATDQVAAALVRTVLDLSRHPGRQLCDSVSIPPPGTPLTPQGRTRLARLGMIAWIEDRSAIAVRALRLGLTGELAERTPSPSFGLLLALVHSLIDVGEWDLAAEYAGTDLVDPLPTLRTGLAALRALVHARRGEHERALTLARETWARFDARSNLPAHMRLLHAAGLASIGAGDHDTGYRYLRSMFDVDGCPAHPYLSPRAIADLAGAAVRCDRAEDARTVLDEVRHAQGSRPSARMTILLHLAEALLGAEQDAEQHFRRATGDPAGPEWPYEHALAHLHHGVWLRRNRGPREAREALARAERIFTELGAVNLAEIAARESTVGTGSRQPGGQPLPVGALTSQEQQVAALAVQGLSNRAIAEQLFISARTVSTHLSRIYRKVGIASRHELTAAPLGGTANR
ncbi:helix-turn-helix transcriptional regulator [Actinoplanes cyaneus]|uniref:Helix-turn-helix transcriptional regulator n=1 Tax=Actinoplanes cyaneus TaxID=52696 RepID=A0A919M5X2_9ACTN|nr:LuxR family transcriptional regulator [Actinoplanes cyaneus]MCW2142044.1 AAA ATPase domain-containing protein [Actinoplanes cyaneus]GID63799.1 helix-turn-helix transcriptional regulator [Actinoplanes cyaneus]